MTSQMGEEGGELLSAIRSPQTPGAPIAVGAVPLAQERGLLQRELAATPNGSGIDLGYGLASY